MARAEALVAAARLWTTGSSARGASGDLALNDNVPNADEEKAKEEKAAAAEEEEEEEALGVAFTSLVAGHARAGDLATALGVFFQRMPAARVRPSTFTVYTLFCKLIP
jgi:pentatricopeptide repeat protein